MSPYGTQTLGEHAILTYSDMMAAFCAQQYLNGFQLLKYKAILHVKLMCESPRDVLKESSISGASRHQQKEEQQSR